MAEQIDQVLAALKAHPGQSSHAIAEAAGLDRHLVARRLPELAGAGFARRGKHARCAVTDHIALTWYPKEAAGAQGP